MNNFIGKEGSTLSDITGDVSRELEKLYGDIECKHERWDANETAKVCLSCRRVLPQEPTA